MVKIQFMNDEHIKSQVFEAHNCQLQNGSLYASHWNGAAERLMAQRVEKYGGVWWELIGGFSAPPPNTNLYKKVVIEW